MSTTSINKQLNNEISQRLHGPYYGTTKTDTVSKYRQSSWRGDMRSDVSPPQQAPVQDRAETQWTVESVLSTMPHRPAHDTTSPVPFFHLLERLKTTKRTGWTDSGIEDGESISDHMYRMANLAMVAPSSIASRKQHVPVRVHGADLRHGRSAGGRHHTDRGREQGREVAARVRGHGLHLGAAAGQRAPGLVGSGHPHAVAGVRGR
ncbi:hypothetical protein BB8028_0007g06790 [Beauveria bassiana]|uniref:HD domain-containing protein n=1 Tax=Beauveria bassiana TaxID=176275 RepID=A0A2S7YND7_BEABA|nr:hypothetical protein BB8028_0007g06790 [Beauveria bassiana]